MTKAESGAETLPSNRKRAMPYKSPPSITPSSGKKKSTIALLSSSQRTFGTGSREYIAAAMQKARRYFIAPPSV